MKRFILLVSLMLICATASAKSYRVKPKHFDLDPNDGVLDPGSPSNPYVIEDEYGNEVGTVEPEYYDAQPGDGFMDEGSSDNEYIYDIDD